MEIIDISWPISPAMTSYKNKKVVKFTKSKIFSRDHARENIITLSTHTGTHIDAPTHFLSKGKDINDLSLTHFSGKCRVVTLRVKDKIEKKHLEKLRITKDSIILFKTRNSSTSPTAKFDTDFVYLAPSAALFLAEKNVKAVGIDYIGIERNHPLHETHRTLLEEGIPIIEGLRLAKVSNGEYMLICLPLNLIGLEAAPARAVLFK